MATVFPASNPVSALSPSTAAEGISSVMLQADNVMHTILEETVSSAENGRLTESGRTACGHAQNVRGPLGRFPASIQLQECPVDQAAGIWHTHVTASELRHPEHSLPDWANVVFGKVDASVVVGTQSSEVVMSASDGGAMIPGFQNAIGLQARSPRDVVQAIMAGQIAAPGDTRARVRQELSPLTYRVHRSFPDIEQRLQSVEGRTIPAHAPACANGVCACHTYYETLSPDVGKIRQRARLGSAGVMQLLRSIGSAGKGEVIGVIAGNIISSLFGL